MDQNDLNGIRHGSQRGGHRCLPRISTRHDIRELVDPVTSKRGGQIGNVARWYRDDYGSNQRMPLKDVERTTENRRSAKQTKLLSRSSHPLAAAGGGDEHRYV